MRTEDGRPVLGWVSILVGLVLASLAGALASRLFLPSAKPSEERRARPIVEIVRGQQGLPDLSEMIDRLCPSVAVILPNADAYNDASGAKARANAFLISPDGWLIAPAGDLPEGPLGAVFGDGTKSEITEMRTDPVSGLVIIKTSGSAASPLSFNDQAFPRVGQFGVSLQTPRGTGCSAATAMIGGDFLADGDASGGFVRLQGNPGMRPSGMPVVSADGRVMGVTIATPENAVIPAPVVSTIASELIRNTLSPTNAFGIRAIDFGPDLSDRLGNFRSGAGIALVQPNSPAAKEGLAAGDIATAVDGTPVSSASELSRALDSVQKTGSLTVFRAGQQLKLQIRRIS